MTDQTQTDTFATFNNSNISAETDSNQSEFGERKTIPISKCQRTVKIQNNYYNIVNQGNIQEINPLKFLPQGSKIKIKTTTIKESKSKKNRPKNLKLDLEKTDLNDLKIDTNRRVKRSDFLMKTLGDMKKNQLMRKVKNHQIRQYCEDGFEGMERVDDSESVFRADGNADEHTENTLFLSEMTEKEKDRMIK